MEQVSEVGGGLVIKGFVMQDREPVEVLTDWSDKDFMICRCKECCCSRFSGFQQQRRRVREEEIRATSFFKGTGYIGS